jgi:hypothetical protein
MKGFIKSIDFKNKPSESIVTLIVLFIWLFVIVIGLGQLLGIIPYDRSNNQESRCLYKGEKIDNCVELWEVFDKEHP